jgi:NADH-quinone oxidoreductase subunit A
MLMRSALAEYLPILVLTVLAVVFAALSFLTSSLLRPRRPTPAKLMPYESGIVPERLPRGERFSVKFYVVAMLFIVFDIETIFLFPWAVGFRQLGLFGLGEMAVFIGLVFVAYVYVWRSGGLDWERPQRRPMSSAAAASSPALPSEAGAPGARSRREPHGAG